MSFEVHNIQRLRVLVESPALGSSGYTQDPSGSIGSMTDVPAIEGSIKCTLERDEKDPGYLLQHIDEARKHVLGKRRGVLSFDMNLAPTGTAAVTAQASITSPLGILLKAIMGGESLNQGSTASTGSTASVINVQSGHGARWAAGRAMVWFNSAGVPELREAEAVSGDAVTLKRAFSAAPASTNPLYNAATYYMTSKPSTTLAMLLEGLENEDRWLLSGGQCEGGITLTFDPTGQQLPRITFNLTFANWRGVGETTTPLTGALGIATYTATAPIVGEAGAFELWTSTVATYAATQLLAASSFTFEPHIQFKAVTAPNGVNTIKAWEKQKPADGPLSGSFTVPYEDMTHFNARNTRDDMALMYMAGASAGNGFAISAPCIQELNPQRVPDAAAWAAQTVQWKARRDIDVGASTSDEAKSPLRIHLW